jgi:hypothetical protein
MKRAVLGGVAIAAALGLAACGSSSGGSSTPNDAMGAFASALKSGDWSAACAVAEPSERDDCNKTLSKLPSEKVTFKDVTYSVSNVGDSTADAKVTLTVCDAGHCEKSSSSGELVKQNGTWYISNSTGGLGGSSSGNSGASGSGNSGNS